MGEDSHRRKRSFGAFAAMLVVWIFGATDGLADPFGDPVKYPRIPALIIAEVKVDGDSASMHDTVAAYVGGCLLYTSPSPRDLSTSRMPSSA